MAKRRADRALVLGGTGLIGNAIVRSLAARRCQVTVLSRRTERPRNLLDLDIRYLTGDTDRFDQLDAWVSGQDLVVDAAAPYALNLFHSSTTDRRRPLEHAKHRTEALLRAALRYDVRLAYIGTLSLSSLRTASGLTGLQRALARRLQPYFQIKQAIETRVIESARAGLRAVILRPSTCFGPWDIKPRAECWLPALLRGELAITLQHRINVVDTRDVAATLIGALGAERYGEPIAVTGHNTSVNELFSLVCELDGGTHEPGWSVPAVFGVLPAVWAELAWSLAGRASPLPSLVPMLLCEQEWVSMDPAQMQLGGGSRPLAETIRDATAWYRSIGYC